MKKYTYYILSQIFYTKENKENNALMPVNNLEKDTKSSDAVVRADALRLLTDMSQNLKDIFPFLYELIKAGANDLNPYVQQVSLVALIKLYENTEIQMCFEDYEDDLRESIFNKILLGSAEAGITNFES